MGKKEIYRVDNIFAFVVRERETSLSHQEERKFVGFEGKIRY